MTQSLALAISNVADLTDDMYRTALAILQDANELRAAAGLSVPTLPDLVPPQAVSR